MASWPADTELTYAKTQKSKEDRSSFTYGSSHSMREPSYDDGGRRIGPRVERFFDTFRRDPNSTFLLAEHDDYHHGDGDDGRRHRHEDRREAHFYDLRLAALENAHIGLSRSLKGRHLQMIAIGGSIGTGLFVVSGKALNAGGPASLLIAFGIIGAMLYCTCQALGELAVIFPIAGSFSSWATRFLDPSWGFAMGWK